MDQRIVAGLGNIYVCEALFRAGLDPWKPAARLATRSGKPTPAAERLAAEIKAVLTDAIRAGGSTLRDYKRADGTSGLFQNEFGVYGRGRRALPEARLPGHGAPQGAGRPVDVLLPGLPALSRAECLRDGGMCEVELGCWR